MLKLWRTVRWEHAVLPAVRSGGLPESHPDASFPKPKSSKKKWIVLASVAIVAVISGVLCVLLLGGKNDYERIYDALVNTLRMESADLSVYDEYHGDRDEYSFCIDGSNYYACEDDRNYVGKYGDQYFEYDARYDEGTFPIRGNSYQTAELSLIDAAASVLTGKSDLIDAVKSTSDLWSTCSILQLFDPDLGNVGSYDEYYYYYMYSRSNIEYMLSMSREKFQHLYVRESEYSEADWQKARERLTEELERMDKAEEKAGKALDVLSKKMLGEEWMNQSCSLTKTEEGGEAVYNLTIRPKRLATNALDAVREYLDPEAAEEMEHDIKYMDNSAVKLKLTIEDGKITHASSKELEFELSLEYYKDKLSEIRFVDDRGRVTTVSFSNVDAVKFDKALMESIMKVCKEQTP